MAQNTRLSKQIILSFVLLFYISCTSGKTQLFFCEYVFSNDFSKNTLENTLMYKDIELVPYYEGNDIFYTLPLTIEEYADASYKKMIIANIQRNFQLMNKDINIEDGKMSKCILQKDSIWNICYKYYGYEECVNAEIPNQISSYRHYYTQINGIKKHYVYKISLLGIENFSVRISKNNSKVLTLVSKNILHRDRALNLFYSMEEIKSKE